MRNANESKWLTGVILADSGETVARPQMSLKQLLIDPLGESAEVNEQSKGHFQAFIRSVMIGGYECGVSLFFHEDTICRAMLVLTIASHERFSLPIGYGAPPDGPQVKFLEDWIVREVGRKPPVSFGWGEIAPVYDPIGSFASVRFIYAEA